MTTSLLLAQTDYGYLKKEDQQYFKNDSMEGQNRLERIDSNVKEINKLHGEIQSMKADIAALKKEVEMLKSKK
jgi:cell division protein FtsB